MMLKCLACGSRIADKAFIQLMEEQNPLVSSDEIEVELDERHPFFECHACKYSYNVLVREDEWERLREEVRGTIVHFQEVAVKAYDRLSRTLNSEKFRKKADLYRETVRYNRKVIEDQ